MTIITGSNWKTCRPGAWTNLWDGPSFGFVYIWTDRPVRIEWRRYASGIPPYMAGSQSLHEGKNTVFSGGPAAYLRIEVNPNREAVMRAT